MLEQHTPSRQKPERHSFDELQFTPFAFRAMHEPKMNELQ